MRCLLQKVSQAKVDIDGKTVGEIGVGLMVLVGYGPDDTREITQKAIERILNYRIFPDDAKPMNRSVRDIKGGLLLVPQFTLMADTSKGLHPGFSTAAEPNFARNLYIETVDYAKSVYSTVAGGRFGADMQVSLCNDGPVTIMLEF